MRQRTLGECWNEIDRLTLRLELVEKRLGTQTAPHYPTTLDGRAIDWRR